MKNLLVFLVCSIVLTITRAQEICNNGMDDDGDGFIDCYDSNCSASTYCKDFFLGEDAQCEVTPPAFPKFTMSLDFASPNETTNHLARIAVGDLNRDGKPEIITMNQYTNRLFILNGVDGSIQQQATVDFDPQWEVAIANLDNDNCGEIFFFGYEDPPGSNNSGYYLYAYDCNLNFIWRSDHRLRGDPINYGLADFDGDGKVELYAKDEIYDAHTGTRLVKSTAGNWKEINGGPVAVDMEGDDNLELVIGCSIYSVNLGTRTSDAGSLTLLKKRNDYFIRNEFNATSVADYNLDGYLDVLASGSTNSNGDNTTVFFWDVHNDILKTYSDPIPGNFTIFACPTQTGQYYKNGWKNGTGRINIADLDGDGKLNISYVSGKFLYALDENLNPMSWSPKVVNEETSGYTGCTLFDFNGDGKSEIVYRDERFLYIIDGTNGNIYNQQACVSRTNREYPIVADVDADGSTELCVTCGFNDTDAINNFCNLGYSRYSQVRVFKSGGEPWVPARRVWNQHGYFNVNVNDDLTIPRKQQKHHLVFSTGSCTTGPNRPLNSFLNQSPFLNIDGCPTYKSPDLAFVNNSLAVTPPTCPDQNFTISFKVQNIGDISLSGNVPISFYNGNPLQAGSIKLGTINVPVNIRVDEMHTVTNQSVSGPGGPFTLYVVLNDDGTTGPPPISLPNTDFLECDYNNNILSASIDPTPVAITALKIQDNIQCSGSSSPDNGAVRAYIPIPGGGENTADYNFYWSSGLVVKPVPADYQGAAINGLPDGVYTVYAVHKTMLCNSATASVTVAQVSKTVKVDITLNKPYDNCKNPNGKLTAIVNDTDGDGTGDPVGNFTYGWYEGNDIFTNPQISISHVAASLKPITYSLIVTEKATGCQAIASYTVPDLSIEPVVTASTVDIICSAANSGSASATVGGASSGYTFNWYNGNMIKPSPDFTGSSYTNLSGGTYTVVAMNKTSKCESDPVTVTVDQSAPVSVTVSNIAPQTSCDPSLPNGSASADVNGSTADYTFEWFRGQNTLPVNLAGTEADATGLEAGVYTVRATDNSTGCSDTEEATIAFGVVTPSITLSATGDLTDCATPNGTVTVNVSPDTPADYTFSWFAGPVAKAIPDFTETGNMLSNLDVGIYTVQAVHKTKHCTTSAITASVNDNTPAINIVQNTSVKKLPTNCNSNNGVLEIVVSAAGNTSGFRIEWFRDDALTPFAVIDNAIVSKQDTLSSGTYTVRATNLDNGCSHSESFDLPFASAQSLDLVSKTNASTCVPQNEGSIMVTLKPTPAVIPGPPPVTFTVNDYIINLYAGKGTSGSKLQSKPGSAGSSNGDGTSNYAFSTLTPGYYTVVATENNPLLGGCASIPVIVEIGQDATLPLINATKVNANTNCAGATPDGNITLDIDGAAPESNYTYSWFEGVDTSAPVLGTNTSGNTTGFGETAQNLSSGSYSVRVVNNSTQCAAVSTWPIVSNPPVISVTDADITITDVTLCSDLNGGAAVITDIRENGILTGTGNYTFQWYDAGLNILPDAVTPNVTNSISKLPAGSYFARVTKNTGTSGLNCASTMIGFDISDQTAGTIGVSLADFTKPTRCLQPANVPGELVATATGNSTAGYTYNWYAGNSATGTILSNNATLSNIMVPAGETEVTYTIQAINSSNQCAATETFILPLEITPVTLTASASPLTFCNNDDGTIFATVTGMNSNVYDYNWYTGNSVKATTDFTGKQVDNLPAGNYTVVAADKVDPFCKSAPATVTINDERIFPVVAALPVAPVTICDPSRPDGVASAFVNGDVVNYTFDWYAGNLPAGTPVFTGSQFGNLPAGTFSVIATHLVTGCADTARVTIDKNTLPIPLPQVQVVSDITSCLDDNGILSASVNGNTGDFIFHWYDENPGQIPDTTSASFSGDVYSGLDEGRYFATATSRHTGCVSPPEPGQIVENKIYPDYEFRIEPASCDQNNGFVSIYMLNNADIQQVVWEVAGTNVTGPNLENIPGGIYSVTVTSTMGCAVSKDVEVGTQIRPFNGLSRNKDGKNDIFKISCIENFPDNDVKIFNRAGTLVYEAKGYDNFETYFDGRSNKGISLMGSDLPDGTYFYIIDKRDGSKPVAGYLEVVK